MRLCHAHIGRARVQRAAVLLLAGAVCHAQPVEPSLLDEFRESARHWTTGVGAVFFSIEPPQDSKFAGRSTYGLDPATGAWFFTDQSRVAGRTPDGIAYRGDADNVTPDQVQALRLPGPLASLIPMAVPLTLLQTTDGLVDLTKDAEGNWVIEYLAFALEGQTPPHAWVAFSPEGKPLRFDMDARPSAGQEAIGYDYEFVPESKEPLLIAIRPRPSGTVSPPLDTVEVEYYPQSRPDLFTIENVLAIATDNRMRTQMKLNVIAAQMPGSDQMRGATEPAPYVQTPLNRARWPLVVTGIIVVAIGLIALFRARMAR